MGSEVNRTARRVIGTVSGAEGTKAPIASGDYNKILQDKTTEIKNVCGVY